jgi:membrane protein required for colicin V production
MNYFDLTFLTVVSVITIRGLFRGLITELLVLVSIVLGFIIATLFHEYLQALISGVFPGIPDAISKMIAFVLIFVAVNIAVRIISKTLNTLATFTFLQPINKIAGALFAFTKVTLLISIFLIIIEFIPGSSVFTDKIGAKDSITYSPVKKFAPMLYNIFSAGSDKSFKDIIPFDADSTASEILDKLN